jgi:hypothetical protein
VDLDPLPDELRDEVAIDLDNFEISGFFQYQAGQRAFARSDLYDEVVRVGPDGSDDFLQDPWIVEEVLAESLTRSVRARSQA